MTPQEIAASMAEGAVIVDMRPPKPFANEHIPGAVNFQFNRADLAERAAMGLPRDVEYVIHAEPEPLARVAVDLLREAGFTVLGFLEGGLKGWKAAGCETCALALIDVEQLGDARDRFRVIDTREGFEYRYGHVPGSECLEWTEPWERFTSVDDTKPLAVICGDQVRSAYVASVMQRAGKDVCLVFGGMADWLERGFPVEKAARMRGTPR